MIFAIPIGYFVAILLLISGVLSGVEFLADRPNNCTRAALLRGLVEAAWPVLAATVVLLLIQINKQLENLRLVADYTPPVKESKKKKKKKPAEEEKDDDYSPAASPASKQAPTSVITPLVPNLAGLAAPIQTPAAHQQSAPHPVPPSSMTANPASMYPNSPIPGGGRVPQQGVPMMQPPVVVLPNRTGKRAPVAQKSENSQGLNFFKVD